MLALGLEAVLALGAAFFAEAVLGAEAFFAVVVLAFATLGLLSVFSFWDRISRNVVEISASHTLGAAAFFSAAGLDSFLASLTGPEGPFG